MSDTVEGLVIEIESSAGSAVSQLDALTQKLQGLKSTVSSSAPLKKFSKNYTELMNTINNTTGVDSSKIQSMWNFASVLSSLNNIKISSSLAKELNNLDFVVENLHADNLAGLQNFINVLSKMREISISSTLPKRLQQIADFGKEIQGQSFSSLDELTTALSKLSSLAEVDSASLRSLTTSMKNVSNATKSATSSGRKYNTVLANIKTKTLVLVRATQMITRATTKSLSVYGDYVETLNLFKMAMGDAAQESYAFAEKAQDLLGIDLTQWMKAQGVFNALATGFGVASDKAALMSQNLTQLAYDISSFYNIDVETAIEKVQSGFAGQIRPVRDLGYDLSQARLEAIALSLGIDKSVKSMTQAEKSQLRYIAMLTQLKQVQGDLSRTLDSPTNQMRILNAQLNQMYRSIGLTLLPILNKVLPYLNAILRVIKMIAEEIASMFGYTLPKITEESSIGSVGVDVEDLTDDLDDATGSAKELKNTLASFDQINLITSQSGGNGSGADISSAVSGFDVDLPTYDFLGEASENKAKQIADDMMKSLRPFIDDFLKPSIKWVVDHIDDIKQVLEIIAVTTIGKKLINSVKDAITQFNSLSDIVKGIGLVTIGLQFSYTGGQDMAKGEWLKGIVKSTVGAAATAIGMSYLFGPTGAVIGLAASLVMTFEGFRAEKVEERRKEITDTFYSIEDSANSLDKVKDSWNNFIDAFTNPEQLEKQTIVDDTKDKVDSIGQAIADLQTEYEQGKVTIEQYSQNIETMYGEMKDAVCKNLEAINNALDSSLSGPLGLWLEAHGVSLDKLRQSFKYATEAIVEEISRNERAISELNKEFEAGVWTEEQYNEKMKELLGPLESYYSATGKNVQATDDFLTSFKNIKIDLTDYDSLIDTLEQVKKGYLDTKDQIDALEQADVSNIEALLPFASPEDQILMQQAIEQTRGYYEAQRQILNSGYTDLIQSFEQQGSFNWAEVYQLYGLEDTHDAIYEQMKNIDSVFSEMYGEAGLQRNETYWTTLMGLMDDYEENAANGMASLEGWNQDYIDKFDIYSLKLQTYSGKNKDALEELKKKSPETYNQLIQDMEKMSRKTTETTTTVTRSLSDHERKVKELEDTYGSKTQKMATDTKTNFDYIVDYVSVGMKKTADECSAKIKVMSDEIGGTDWSVDKMKDTMNKTADVLKDSNLNTSFTNGINDLLKKASGEITSYKTDFSDALKDSLTPNTQDVIDIGVGIGKNISKGIEDSKPDIDSGTNSLFSGLSTAFNTFGGKVYDYFVDMGDLGKTVLSGIGMQYGSSTFNNTYKKPKITGYAKGGFPDSADFFYANENGVPEYVGTMGGRTAVATNNDIVKGVSDGVYRAITSTGIQNDVKKLAKKNGNVVFAPSAEAGKVMTQSVNMYSGTGGRY